MIAVGVAPVTIFSAMGLNIFAIATFLITMSILLGTPLGLSPLVPSMAAILLLGFYGVDTAYWEGKGTTQFLLWLKRRSPAYRKRVLIHEAGHFLAAYLLNIPIRTYTIGAGIEGAVEIALTPLTTLTSQDLEKYCTIWMAGITAERLFCEDNLGESTGGQADLQQMRRAIAQIPDQYRADAAMRERWAVIRAKHLLQSETAAFWALVACMERGASVEECGQAIDQHRGSTP